MSFLKSWAFDYYRVWLSLITIRAYSSSPAKTFYWRRLFEAYEREYDIKTIPCRRKMIDFFRRDDERGDYVFLYAEPLKQCKHFWYHYAALTAPTRQVLFRHSI